MWSRQTSGSSRPASRRPPTTGQNQPRTAQSRPWTGQSRVSTARPQTSASTRHEGNFVIAVLEGRGVGREVGLAALDKDIGRVILVQLSDCQTYVKTLHQMHLHKPSLVLVPDTFLSASDTAMTAIGSSGKRTTNTSLLVEFIREEFPDTQLEPISRKYWNETSGLEFIQQLCVEDEERAGTILAVSSKYYVLSACSALFKYAEIRQNTRFSAGSLRIKYSPVDGTMMIDPESAKNLELVGNMSHRKSYHSVFGILNHTYTAMAARLLRVNILAPITVQTSIDARLDVVEELVQDEDLFNEVRSALKTLNSMDFDKLIATLAASETVLTNSAKAASNRVTQMLNLRNAVRNLPLLQKSLGNTKSQLLRIIHDMLLDERLEKIDSLIRVGLNEDTAPTKYGIAAVNARVYAVKANHNRLLDVARETYKENVGDIYSLCNALTQAHELPLTLAYQESGFVFSLKKTDLEGELPKGFINVTLKKGKWQFSSMELKKMNARMQDALDETLILSDKIIQDLVAEILVNVGALYKASEAVALVDMLWSFSHSAIMRPEFTGTLAVKSGRHPILETVQSAGTLVPNDIYCDDSSSFQIIQGPNMSGKSTYLRQVGLLSVMAMCGSFVPAEYASFRIHDALLTRLSNDDDLEKNLSTFASEMATSAMILGLATERSLILVDELGRGTSPREGIGISHAIAEGLIEQKDAHLFCFRHFAELSTTLSRQPSVVKYIYLWNQRTRQSASNFGMLFQYKIVDGTPEETTHYGLELARLADLPIDVLTEATRVSKHLTELQTRHQAQSDSSKIAMRRKALLKLRTNLTQAFEHSALPDEELLAYIGRFQADITKVFLYSTETD
ncbi:muts domain V-domain-containing protein [Lentinula aff. lateritia]|uniref:Muts domain V-domain-containing protein n=1 Tax=Lentinula aff. lateritia TaxID=2804960 RepID=A0ACC1TTP3_9AGAR|nr:muts domain V-domain-containing protein [Lentinula aff. lateritia]